MKQIKRLTVLLLVGLAITAQSQNPVDSIILYNGALQPNPMRGDVLPKSELIPTSQSLALQLPSEVSNDTSRFFPPIFHQVGLSCVHAAEIGYTFTYEMNRLRGVEAGVWDNQDPNLFPHLYSFNFVNGGYGYDEGTPVYSGFETVLSNGCPMYNDWYNSQGVSSDVYWMDGYEKYYRGMSNRVVEVKTITLNNNNASVDKLKHWLYDHAEASNIGGLAVVCVYTDGWETDGRLPQQSSHYNELVIRKLGNGEGNPPPAHAMTIVGYDDNVCYDINEDGYITTTIDINGDGIVNVYDSEYGALKIANSSATWFGNNGFIWLPYSLLDEIMPINYARRVYVCEVEERGVQLAYKATIGHLNRGHLSLQVGYGLATNEKDSYNIFNYQGGDNVSMNGFDNNPITIGLDFSSKFDALSDYKHYYLQAIDNNTSSGSYNENNYFIRDFSLLDYRWGETFELPCPTTNKPIGKNTTTTLSINYDLLPFDGNPVPTNWESDKVARRRVNVSSNTQIGDDTHIDLYGTDMYDCELFVKPGTTLTVGDDVTITAKRGTCRIEVNGSLVLGEGVVFRTENGASLVVDLSQAESVSGFINTTFDNCTLLLPTQSLSFSHCTFNNTSLDVRNLDCTPNLSVVIDDCSFTASSGRFDHAIEIDGYDTYVVKDCEINGGNSCYEFGVYIKNCGNATMDNVRNIVHNDICNCLKTGLVFYASTGNIIRNTITGNTTGVQLLNNSNVGSFMGSCGAMQPQYTQYIHDNGSFEVHVSESCMPSEMKYNYICSTESHPYIKYEDSSISGTLVVDISDNRWGTTLNPSSHFVGPSGVTFDYLPLWSLGMCPTVVVRSDQALLASADSLSQYGEYYGAKTVYRQVVNDYPTTTSAQTALKSLYSIEFVTDYDFVGLKSYYLNDLIIVGNAQLRKLASSLANKCDEVLGNYSDAISWYEGVIMDTMSSYNDSVFAAIDLGDLYLRMEESGEKGAVGKLPQFVPVSRKAHEKQTMFALSQLPKRETIHTSDYPSDYWMDVVTEQPEGYVMDEQGNVTISSAEGLAWFAAVVNGRNGQEANDFEGNEVKLVSDIDMGAHLWEAIGGSQWSDSIQDYQLKYFKGTFDGKGHEVSNLVGGDKGYFRRVDELFHEKCHGLFGNLYNAEIKGLKLNDFVCLNRDDHILHFGSVACYSEQSVIDRCVSKGSIYEFYNGQYENNEEIHAGGLVYNNLNSLLRNCVFVADSCVSYEMGGIAHSNITTLEDHRAEISNCYFYGEMYDYPLIFKDRTMHTSAGIVQYNSTDPEIEQGSIVRNCYYYPTEPRGDMVGYRAAVAWWHRGNSVIENCYYLAEHDVPFYTGVVSRPDEWATVNNTSAFYYANDGCVLENPVEIGGEMVDDLKEALNHWVAMQQNSADYETWCDDAWMEQGGAPLLCTVYEATEEKAERPSIVAPNPVVNNLSIISDEVISVAVYDATGKMMVRTTDKHIDMTMYKPGIYIVSITFDDGKCQSEKVIKK